MIMKLPITRLDRSIPTSTIIVFFIYFILALIYLFSENY